MTAVTAVSLGHDHDAEIVDVNINAQVGVLVRDKPSLLATLGLPAETAPEIILEALVLLKQSETLPQEDRIAGLRDTRLVNLLGAGTNLVTLYTTLLSFIR